MEYKSELHLQSIIWREFYDTYREFRLPPVGNTPRCLLIHNLLNAKSRIEASRLIGCGLTTGFPDLTLYVPRKGYHALIIELKLENEKPEKRQKEVMKALEAQGYKVVWSNCHEEVREIIKEYLNV